jgi:hypothetical protein
LALGIGVDNMFLLAHTYSENMDVDTPFEVFNFFPTFFIYINTKFLVKSIRGKLNKYLVFQFQIISNIFIEFLLFLAIS